MTNVTASILSKVPRRIHLIPNHPLNILKSRIESHLLARFPGYSVLDSLHPAVTLCQNFDNLLVAKDHPSRLPSDTYYINKDIVLRTHTSAHQSQVLSSKSAEGYLLTADVYRRDEIDTTHYPVFHQMEGIRTFSRKGGLQLLEYETNKKDAWSVPTKDKLSTAAPIANAHSPSNPVQTCHSTAEAELVGAHLRRSLEGMVLDLFRGVTGLQIRWVDAYFPFTSPSWEMEVFYNGKWLELCGCGVMQQEILNLTGNDDKIGWAFGLGLERIAMVMFNIPDIRLFWSQDERFLSQFTKDQITTFSPYSKYPACYKDISFWCPDGFHDNDMFEVVRDVAGDLAEDVSLIDVFKNKKTGKTSKCYRINYRSMDRTCTNAEVDALQDQVRRQITNRFGVQLR